MSKRKKEFFGCKYYNASKDECDWARVDYFACYTKCIINKGGDCESYIESKEPCFPPWEHY